MNARVRGGCLACERAAAQERSSARADAPRPPSPHPPSLLAAAGVVCSESSFAIALVVAGYLKKQPGFYLLAVLPAVFSIWAWMEMPAPAAKAASTSRSKAKSG